MKRGTKIGWLLVALSVVLSVWVLIGSNSRADDSDYTVEGGILTHYNGDGGDVNDIPSDVETIATTAFANNQNITSITIPANVKTVESSAFMNCQNLQSVDMSSSAVSVIPANCFDGTSSLTSVNLPAGTTTLSTKCFNASKLANITIPASVAVIESDAFSLCDNLGFITVDKANANYKNDDNGSLINKTTSTLEFVPRGYAGSEYTVADGVTTIGKNAFQGNANIKKVTYPASVTTILTNALSNMTNYTDPYLPATITTIEEQSNWNPSEIRGSNPSAARDYAMSKGIPFVVTAGDDGAIQYTVSFNTDGGAPQVANQLVNAGTMATEPTDAVTKEGYTFAGWFADGASTKFDFANTAINNDITLTAHWTTAGGDTPGSGGNTGKTHTVNFVSDGGTPTYNSVTVKDGETVANPGSPVKEGYTFNGWYNGTQAFDFANTKITSDLTLKAKWTAKSSTSDKTFTVSFNVNGGSGSFAAQSVKSGDTASDPGAPTREGYTFNGWYNGSSKYDFTTPVTGNLTLKAMWTADTIAKSNKKNTSTNGSAGNAAANGKDDTPATAGPVDARYFLCLAVLLAGIAFLVYSRSSKLTYVSKNSKRK